MLKMNRWSPIYYAQVRIVNPKTHVEYLDWVPMLLPHEIIKCLYARNGDKILARDSMDPLDLQHMADVERKMNARVGSLLGLGLWLDGMACKWDRTETIETIILSFPGWPGRWRNVRIPLLVLEHRFVVKGSTFDDLLAVVAWSLEHALLDVMPSQRHDGRHWLLSDAKRKKMCGNIGCASALCRITGDWKMFKEIFRFPQHNEVKGCCCKCNVTPAGIRATGSDAPWRSPDARLDHRKLIHR